MAFRPYLRLILLAVCAVLLGATTGYSQARGAGAKPAAAAASRELLALCGRCPSPTVTTKMGVGTANARAEARMTKSAVVERDGPCDGDATNACIQRETAKIYRASADCTAGRITTIMEQSYTLAGIWDNSDIGGGETKWKDKDGQIVGRDNASDGLSISQQWQVLCPAPVTPALLARAAAPNAAAPAQARTAAPPAVNTAQARPAAPAAAQTATLCAGQRYCDEVGSFVATVTDFRTSMYQTTARVVSLTLRIQNKTNRALILGYVPGSALAIDEQGNRFTVAAATNVRGIGEITNQFDPKFNIGPGQAGDTRFELTWRIDSRAIIGQRAWDLDISIREVNEVGPGQYRFGSEHALQFKGLQPANLTSAAPAGAPLPTVPGGAGPARSGAVPPAAAPVAAAQVPAAPAGNGCAGKQRCYDAGTFTAEIVNAASSFSTRSGRWHVVGLNVRFTNRMAEPINLGWVVGAAALLDNFGNRYGASAAPDDVRGMGKVTGNAADPQFSLQPGESRAATFSQFRAAPANQPIGTAYTFDMSIAHLQVLYNGQQVRTVREHNLTFTDFGLGATGPAGAGAAPPAAVPAVGAPVSAAPVSSDGCAGKKNCFDAGTFTAEILNAAPSFSTRSGRWHIVGLNVRFTNRTAEPINLGWVVGAATLLDNFGNRYGVSAAPDDVRGMGKVTGNAADPQFALRPGESRAATFSQFRAAPANQPIGTAYTFDMTIAHLQVLYNGQQVRTVREHTLTFTDVGLNAPGAATSAAPATGTTPGSIKDTADKIRGIFGGGQKK